jgi:hypothetical protein
MASQSSEFWTSPIGGNWAYWVKAAKSIGEFVGFRRGGTSRETRN